MMMIKNNYFAKCLPYFIHKNILTVNPNKNPAGHWSGWSPMNGLVINGPKKKVKKE